MLDIKEIMVEKLFPRHIINQVKVWEGRKEAVVILGPRRAGKTCLLKLLVQRYYNKGMEAFYFDAEDPEDRDILDQGPKALKQFLGKGGMIFIDEFHLLEDPSHFVKLCVDHYPEFKLYLTGSSSIAALKKFKNSLIGRTVEFELFPLNFKEFLVFRHQDRYRNLLEDFNFYKPHFPSIKRIPKRLISFLEEYLVFGGFPEVVLCEDTEMKAKLVSQIFRIYALRDLKLLFSARKETVFRKVFIALSGSIGSPVNISSIASDIGVSSKTVSAYIELLKSLYLIKELTPFCKNPRSEIKKSPKIYFIDTGLLSWARGSFASLSDRSELAGLYAENAIYLGFLNRLRPEERVYYWKSKMGTEIDFILSRGREIIPVEVKYRERPKAKIPAGFLKRYGNYITHFIVATKNHLEIKQVYDFRQFFIPIHFLI